MLALKTLISAVALVSFSAAANTAPIETATFKQTVELNIQEATKIEISKLVSELNNTTATTLVLDTKALKEVNFDEKAQPSKAITLTAE